MQQRESFNIDNMPSYTIIVNSFYAIKYEYLILHVLVAIYLLCELFRVGTRLFLIASWFPWFYGCTVAPKSKLTILHLNYI